MISSSGKPAEKPSDNMRNEAGSRYTASVSRQRGLPEGDGVGVEACMVE